MHHRHMGSNYGLYFTFWDRLMGTMALDYEEVFHEVTSRPAPHGPSREEQIARERMVPS
jgi:Delta7-sterol 5-desaturase